MKKLTPKQRAKIYLSTAIKIDKSRDLENVCPLLARELNISHWDSEFRINFSTLFPEFNIYNPGHDGDWWKESYEVKNWNSVRVIALLFAYHMALDVKE